MVEQLGSGMAIVNFSELGTNCWHPCRFIRDDGRCDRVYTCNYPEKKKCQAVHAEIRRLKEHQANLATIYENVDNTIEALEKMVKK